MWLYLPNRIHDNAERPPVDLVVIQRQLAAITDYLKERVWTKATTEIQTAGPSERPSWTPGQSGSS
jgi:hypothetical protein